MEVTMFGRFSNAIDALMAVQNAVEAASRSDYYERGTTAKGGYPFIDLFRKGEETVLTVEVPGMKKEDIKIEIKNNLFRIFGERKLDYPEDASFHRIERRSRKFDRTIRLPHRVNVEQVKASYENGVLQVVLPVAESDKPRQINVA
jgi:HSP20 family protein